MVIRLNTIFLLGLIIFVLVSSYEFTAKQVILLFITDRILGGVKFTFYPR